MNITYYININYYITINISPHNWFSQVIIFPLYLVYIDAMYQIVMEEIL